MSKIDERFIVNLKGKQFVTYEGLLDLAHQKGLISMEVELLQIPTNENEMIAIVKATAKTEKETFIDIGDAGPNSTNSMIRPHIIRMASTRAKARALRDLTNVGMTAFEELGEEDEQVPVTSGAANKTDPDKQAMVDNSLASDKQLNFMYKLVEDKNYGSEAMKKYIKTAYNKDSSKALTKKEASEVIEMLQGLGG
ncbi:hypothetical protein RBU61_14255 [Tissierella sp. MB52-C2]|uniref:hypothetical protein n=1 Tax=Tissierella sp. MB52-C2 TaxID=3070999 RepID=UPI00280A9D17|nr:hypothetical protein [Tissierella sp. MB52-C2]WMM24078.1 hypothetical protein RBU61_14255 [Tissierella sp. MB52-C2]